MYTLILDGSTCAASSCEAVRKELTSQLQAAGSEVETVALRETKIAPCLGCFGCWVKTPGECVINDAGREVTKKVAKCDLQVMLTPLTFGCYSPELKKASDRLIPILSPFFTRIDGLTRHCKRYKRYPRLLGLATSTQNDTEAADIFSALVEANANNFYSPAVAAGVLIEGDSEDSWASSIRALLAQVGVGE